MRSLIEPLAQEQHGLLTRRDLQALGISQSRMARAVRRGELVKRGRGIYALPDVPLEPDVRSTSRAHHGVVSHDTAARWWGMELAHAPASNHLTVPRNRGRRRDAIMGWTLHRADVPARERMIKLGLCVTTPVRTVLDCARMLSLADAVALADSALRKRLVTLAALHAAVAGLPRGPGRRKAQSVVACLDAKSGSVLESLLRVLLRQYGLLPPETQFAFTDAAGRLVGYFDFAWPALHLIVEADGFEFHRQREHLRRDCRRHNAITLRGWWLLRFTWEDVVLFPEQVVETVRETIRSLEATRQ